MSDKAQLHGRIVKALGGFYYVRTDSEYGGELVECRARGIFRKEELTPYVGDLVCIELTEEDRGYVMSIDERTNHLIRPPVANIDMLLLVVSSVSPVPNLQIIDKMLAVARYKDIPCALAITKADMSGTDEIAACYRHVGYPVFVLSSTTGQGVQQLAQSLAGKLTVFTGNTGVGKSTLLNAIVPDLDTATGETSQKLGRGRHTTRHVELYEAAEGYVIDTPGFSSVEIARFASIKKDEIQHCFVEFEDLIQNCKFTGCSHTKEKGCAILQALADGEIEKSRHESYLAMYEDAKKINDWD